MIHDYELNTTLAILALGKFKGIGPKSILKIISNFNTVQSLRDADSEKLTSVVSPVVAQLIRNEEAWKIPLAYAEDMLHKADRLNVSIINYQQEAYPDQLKNIPDFPLILYVKGDLRGSQKKLACVGTRHPTKFGVEVSGRLVSLFTMDGWGIVSGLALGVDSICHSTALDHNGYTIAILANGLDTIYPKTNMNLAEKILSRGGALLSEQPPGTEPLPAYLVSRDRLQSGLSHATIVMQTGIKGGTMHTARFSVIQNRPIYVPLPPEQHITEEQNQGLIALGQKNGIELKDIYKDSAFANGYLSNYLKRPIARLIKGTSDYHMILEELNRLTKQNQSKQNSHNLKQPSLF